MSIEERVARLEQENKQLKERVDMLSKIEQYVTPAELAEKLHCSKNHIYVQIRNGYIKAINIGSAIRIPMSQFEDISKPLARKQINNKSEKKSSNEKLTMLEIKNLVFK